MLKFWKRCSEEKLMIVRVYCSSSFIAFISDTEKGVNMIPLKEITDFQQLAYKLGKRML